MLLNTLPLVPSVVPVPACETIQFDNFSCGEQRHIYCANCYTWVISSWCRTREQLWITLMPWYSSLLLVVTITRMYLVMALLSLWLGPNWIRIECMQLKNTSSVVQHSNFCFIISSLKRGYKLFCQKWSVYLRRTFLINHNLFVFELNLLFLLSLILCKLL